MKMPGSVEDELVALQDFLTATDGPAYENDANVARLRSAATKLYQHLRRPIRMLIAGGDAAGDLGLANALSGDRLISPAQMPDDFPPLVFTYGRTVSAAPGWWGKKVDTKYEAIDLGQLARHNPDFVILQIPNELLRQINILHVPGIEGRAYADRLQKIADRSDMLVWRTTAAQAWDAPERQIWQGLPASIRDLGIMAVTYVDAPEIEHTFKTIVERLLKEAQPNFKFIFPLKTQATADIRHNHGSSDWKSSGGQAMVAGILQVADEFRKNEASKARVTIDRHFAPYVTADGAGPGHAVPAADDQDHATPLVDDIGQNALPNHPILAEWQTKIAGLLALLEKAEDIESSGFLATSSNMVVDMADLISEPGVLNAETEWLLPQFLDAVDLLILLELEDGDEPIVEAINVLLQLGRDLTWIASKS